MELNRLINYCLHKPGAVLDFPFGEIPMCIKVCGKIFAEIYPKANDYKITLKCEPERAEFYRHQYSDIVVPGYHVPNRQKIYWNTVFLNEKIEEEILNMVDHSYNEVKKKLKKAERMELEKKHGEEL